MTIVDNSLTSFRKAMLSIVKYTFAQDTDYKWDPDRSLTKIQYFDSGTDDKENRDFLPRIVFSRDGILSQRESIDNRKNLDLETFEHTVSKNRVTTAYFLIRAQELIPLEYLADQLESGIWFARGQLAAAGVLLVSPAQIGPPAKESGYHELVVSAAFSFRSESRITYEDTDYILSEVDLEISGLNSTKVEAEVP